MSRTFSTNAGSVESLKVSLRCGCSPKARQTRPTVVAERPAALAMERRLQWVPPAGIAPKAGVAAEDALELWAASLRDVKRRIRPRFTRERVAVSAGLFLDRLLGPERRK